MKTNIKNRILICGDSITRGVIFDENQKRYTNAKNPVASEVAQKMHLDIDNLSKFGNTVKKAINTFRRAISEKKYKYVIFELGGNDCDFNWKAVAGDPKGIHIPNVITSYSIHYTKLYDFHQF